MAIEDRAPDAIEVDGDRKEASELELIRRESAGKDRKITELQRELEAHGQADTERTDEVTAVLERAAELAEVAGRLAERERTLEARELASNRAIEERLPLNLLMRGQADLDATVQELKEFERSVIERSRGVKPVGQITGSGYGLRQKEKPRLGLAHIGSMTASELARIPLSLRDKLGGLA